MVFHALSPEYALYRAHMRDNILRDANVSQFGLFVFNANLAEYRSENQYKINLQLHMEMERKKSSSWYCFAFLLCSLFSFIVHGI